MVIRPVHAVHRDQNEGRRGEVYLGKRTWRRSNGNIGSRALRAVRSNPISVPNYLPANGSSHELGCSVIVTR